MVNLKCSKCKGEFSIMPVYVKVAGTVAIAKSGFSCPYCKSDYAKDDLIEVIGVSGGVTLSGHGTWNIGGDVVGGDLHKRG